MRQKMNYFFALSAALALASTSSQACSLVPPDAMTLKKSMAKEIAYRLGIDVKKMKLDDITAPELHTPLELGADCSGLGSYHHISGFRIELESPQFKVKRIGLGNEPAYYTAAGAVGRYRGRIGRGFYGGLYGRWPGAGVQPNYWRARKTASGGGAHARLFGLCALAYLPDREPNVICIWPDRAYPDALVSVCD